MYIFKIKSYFYRMKNKNKLKQIITSLVLLSFLWLIFFISTFILKKENSNNLDYIPSDAEVAIRIDAKELIKSTLFSIIFEAKDESTIQKIKEYLLLQETKDEKFNATDLNLFSDIVIFSLPFKEGKVIGVSFNLQNSNDFEKNIIPLLVKNQVVQTIDHVGFILTYLSDSEIELSQSELTTFFKNSIKKRMVFPLAKNSVFQVQTNGDIFGRSTYFATSDIQLQLLKSSIEVDGLLSISGRQASNCSPSKLILNTSKEDFHFSSSIIPQMLQDSLAKLLNKMDYTLPKIKSISMNYKGIEIKKDRSGTHPLPNLDILIEFNKEFSINTFITNSGLTEKLNAIYSNNELTIAGVTYYVKQVNTSTVSIGTTKNITILKNTSNQLFSANGNLSSLLKIEGGGILVAIMKATPIFHSFIELFDSTEKFDVSICKTSNNQAKLKGNIVIKKGHSTINEAIKFLFGVRAIQ